MEEPCVSKKQSFNCWQNRRSENRTRPFSWSVSFPSSGFACPVFMPCFLNPSWVQTVFRVSRTGPSVSCPPSTPQHLFPVLASCQGQLPAKTPIRPALSLPAKHLIKGDSCRTELCASQHCCMNEKWGENKHPAPSAPPAHPERWAGRWAVEATRPKPGRDHRSMLGFFFTHSKGN